MHRRRIIVGALFCTSVLGCQRSIIDASDTTNNSSQIKIEYYQFEPNLPPPPPPPIIVKADVSKNKKPLKHFFKEQAPPPRAPPDCQLVLPPSRPFPHLPVFVDGLADEVFDKMLEDYVADLIRHDREYRIAVEKALKAFNKKCR